MKDFVEEAGWGLVHWGLIMIGLTALLSLARGPDAPSEAFFWLYVIAYTSIWHGFQLLKRSGAWPPPDANRP